ncbi:hotdog fold thioesterase [Siccirubricoccus sp. KC 17139]|uniref:Hotdog fold thioesterase n=1 Tax=Siccirubricoccus soli TaxID=2899147 RepID=A0ABT1D9H4_9PROT|nr:hotdog fold thioesterase [Siccirubricoccus soli]MCP2684698.1 hotdog fold thioesterase [Siccirubricoccus soli]
MAERIWKRDIDAASFLAQHDATLPGLLGVRMLEFGPDFARAAMPVDSRHVQPFGILHGGGSVVLAETIGSYCSLLCTEEGNRCVGVEVSASHLAPVFAGDTVEALCRPLRLGRKLHVWHIELRRGDGTLSCVARLTTAVQAAR